MYTLFHQQAGFIPETSIPYLISIYQISFK
nr:MAG TPA: hypothetical protein [Caudoviricetes sp.]